MKIELKEVLARGYASHPRDVRQVKQALACLGFYNPKQGAGIMGEPDPEFWAGLRAFQRAHMIPFADTTGPGSVTVRVMNEDLAALEAEGALYIWRTAGDDKVRGEHAARSGKIFSFAAPPDGEQPGEDYNCRCWAEPLNPSRHLLAEEARRAQEKLRATDMTSGAMGMPLPDNAMPPELQAISATTVLWGGARVTIAACWGNQACRAWMVREGAKIVLENSHHIPPKDLPAFPDAKKVKKQKGGRDRWIDSKGKIYEWDYKKGEIELYDKTGKRHQGGFDPKTGARRSKPVPGREIEK